MPERACGTSGKRLPVVAILIALCLTSVVTWLGWDFWRKLQANRWEAAPAGFSSQVFVDGSGNRFPLVLYRPHDVPAGRRPGVILFLNGLGENGDDGVSQLSNNFGGQVWSLRGRFPMFVVAPQMSQYSEWTRDDSAVARAAIEMIDLVVQRCGADSDRIYVTGPSSGGAGTMALADRHPGTFAALAPIATGGLTRADELPVWLLLNGGDWQHLVEQADRSFVQRLADGASPQRTVYNQSGHNAWANAYNDPALYDWFGRHRRLASAEFPLRYRLIELSSLASLALQVDSSQQTLMHTADLPSGHLLLAEPSDHLHFEYYSAQRVPCRLSAWVPDNSGRLPEWRSVMELDLKCPESGSSCLSSAEATRYGLASPSVLCSPIAGTMYESSGIRAQSRST